MAGRLRTVSGGGLEARVFRTIIEDRDLLRQWDTLAVAASEPRSLSAVVNAWYRRAGGRRPVRTITIWSGDVLVGVVPLSLHRDRWGRVICRMAGRGTIAGVQPLFAHDVPGVRRADIEQVAGAAIAGLRPLPDKVVLESAQGAAAMLAAGARGARRPPRLESSPVLAPFLDLRPEPFQRWSDGLEPRAESEKRRRRRRLVDLGYRSVALSDAREMSRRIPVLRDLYNGRKAKRGGEGIDFDSSMSETLDEVFSALAPTGRVTVFSWERDDIVLALSVVLACGQRASGWITAFGELESRYSPGLRINEDSIEWARASGYLEFDLGPGNEEYKAKLSSGTVVLEDASLDRRDLFPLNTPASLVTEGARARYRALRQRRADG